MKSRLDQLLVEKSFYSSREKAKRHIMAGDVLVDNKVITKAGLMIDAESNIRIKESDRYVSRGGYKLEKALNSFSVDVHQLNILDVGSSTGGFTDCLLQNKANFVYSVDVGYNQLDYKLRNHDQVKVLENLNAKNLAPDLFEHPLHLAVIDVSFISLTKILEPVLKVLSEKKIIALVKPQFEVGQDIPHFKGIVKSVEHHLLALKQVDDFAQSIGLFAQSVTYSPIKGPKGNMEFLIYWSDSGNDEQFDFDEIVKEAHEKLS